jgi:hypothetical protein
MLLRDDDDRSRTRPAGSLEDPVDEIEGLMRDARLYRVSASTGEVRRQGPVYEGLYQKARLPE